MSDAVRTLSEQDRILLENERLIMEREVVHACPPKGSDLTTCCQKSPFILPRYHRLTLESARVTCKGGSAYGYLQVPHKCEPIYVRIRLKRSLAEPSAPSVGELCENA